MPFCHIPDIICPSNVHLLLSSQRWEREERYGRHHTYPSQEGSRINIKTIPRLVLISPLKLQQLEEGKNDPGGERNHAWVAGGGSKISTEQVLPGQGGTESSLQEPRCADRGCPGEDPPKISGSTGVPHRRACLGKDVKVPQEKNKILDSSNHLLSPDSSSNIHRSPSRAGCRSRTRLLGPERRGGRGGAGPGGPGVWRSRRSPGAPPARRGGRSHDAETASAPLPPPPKKCQFPLPQVPRLGGRLGTIPGTPGCRSGGEELIPEGEMPFGAEMWFQTTEPEPQERSGGPALTPGCFWAAPVPLSLQLPWHPHPSSGLVGLGARVHCWREPRARSPGNTCERGQTPGSPPPWHRVCPPQIAGPTPGHEEMDFICVPPRGGIRPKLKAAHGSHRSEWEEGSGRVGSLAGGGAGAGEGGRGGVREEECFGRSGGGLREPVAAKKEI